MRAIGALVIISGFVVVWIIAFLYWTAYQAKRLASREGRKEIANEIGEFTSFVVNDKGFHREFNKGFRGLYILLAILLIALIGTALGLG